MREEALRGGRGRGESHSLHCWLENEGRGHGLRLAGSLQKLEEARPVFVGVSGDGPSYR